MTAPQEVIAASSGHVGLTFAIEQGSAVLRNETTNEFEQPCAIRDVLDRIGDQWSLLVLDTLQGGTMRFNELMRAIGDVSKQMLSRTLKHLEQDGFVRRTVYAEVPPRVEYELTELGRSFLVPMQGLVAWADTHHGTICESRRLYGREGAPQAPKSSRGLA